MLRIHKEGTKILLIILLALFAVNFLCDQFLFESLALKSVLFLISLLFFLAVISFFRNPERYTEAKENEVIAPADGKVVVIEETEETEYFHERRKQISIFMSPANVHVNRTPLGGEVKYVQYHKGKYLVAWHPKSSTENERNTVVIANRNGEILFRQIAGIMARRIICYLKVGEQVAAGDEMGFIKFGSRVDVFVPPDAKIMVSLNQQVKGGETMIAKLQVEP